MPSTFPYAFTKRYTLYQELGRGGFAEVYLARDEEQNSDVALKLLSQQATGNAAWVARFACEFKLAARLDHPNIVRAYEQGEEAGRQFIVMQLVRGSDLRKRIQKTGPVSVPEALQFAAHIASALDYAHDQGVVHRDVQSANILLDETGKAMLSDFGLVRATQDSFSFTLDSANTKLGTVEYFSPEKQK